MDKDEFYVGYLPTPPGLKRWLWCCVIAILLAAATVAAVGASRQRDPGEGQWNLDQTTAITGTFIARPYPMIQSGSNLIVLVADGKHGALADASLNGRSVRATGHPIDRGDLHLLEIATIEPMGLSSELLPSYSSPQQVALQGEIIDSKCFAGAMKPGDGKPHKACAVLCIRGGIPPAFITTGGDHFLLVDEAGGPLNGDRLEAIVPFIADPVRLNGKVQRFGGLSTLTIEGKTVKRM